MIEPFSLTPEQEAAPKQATIWQQPLSYYSLLAVAFGGGTNSTAMLCGFLERGIRPDMIAFADVGGELEHTYDHVAEMDAKCRAWWGVGIEIVSKTYQGQFEGLEKECLRGRKMPALAYGSRACSVKYKSGPQNDLLKKRLRAMGHSWASVPSDKRLKAMGKTRLEWVTENCPSPRQSIRAIGFDAGEGHRNAASSDPWADNWFPLIDWQWRRKDCIAAISRHGITQPGKSACFFCPAMKRQEIVELKASRPDLYARAIAIEQAANGENGANKERRGLTGRSLMWSQITANDEAQSKLWDFLDENDESSIPCGCYDG